MENLIDFLKNVDFDRFDAVINIGGVVLVLGREIIELIDKQGTLDNIGYIKIADKSNIEAEIQRARLVKLIEG